MKHIAAVGTVIKYRLFLVVGALISLLLVSCEPEGDKLGVDIFPPSDTILIYTDTLTNIKLELIKAERVATSVYSSADASRTYFLGSIRDTMTGLSKAEIVTEFGISQLGVFGDDPLIDSLVLYLYIADVVGDTTQEMHISVYEFLEDLDMDSTVYYSDYDVSGKYDPTPILEAVIIPKPETLYEFEIDNQAYLDRIHDAAAPADSNFLLIDRFQEKFPGLYITSETVTTGGALAKVQLANAQAGLKFKFLHDSLVEIAADTIPYSTYNMTFNNYYAQKVNIFHHDYTGTPLEALLDNPDAEPDIAYVKGMAGVNVKVTLPDVAAELGFEQDDKIAINAAKLVFYIIPDSISGIAEDEYPARLMMDRKLADGTYLPLYDYITLTNEFYYGKLTRSNNQSAFLDPLYFYNFHIGRHLQSVLANELENTDLIIYRDQPASNADIIKFWSNYSGQKGGLRLELIYTKF